MSRLLPLCLLCLLSTAAPAWAGDSDAPLAAEAEVGPDSAVPQVRWAMGGEMADSGYRVSLARGALDFGALFEQPAGAVRTIEMRSDSAAFVGTSLPSLSFGLRKVGGGPAPASSLVERAAGASNAVPYMTKVGIEWKPAKSQIFVNRGLALRLGSDDRLTMRLRKGSLGLYYRRNF